MSVREKPKLLVSAFSRAAGMHGRTGGCVLICISNKREAKTLSPPKLTQSIIKREHFVENF